MLEILGFTKPVFIVGVPRSGTSILFRTLGSSPELWTTYVENNIWNHTIASHWGENGQFADKNAFSLELKEKVDTFYRERCKNIEGSSAWNSGCVRFLDKTPLASLQIELINELYPDAYYVYLYRDGRNVVNSILNVYESDDNQHPKMNIDPLERKKLGIADNSDLVKWWGPLPPGWREFINKPLSFRAASMWVRINSVIQESLGSLADDKVMTLSYEKLMTKPLDALESLCAFIDIEFGPQIRKFAKIYKQLDADKWHGPNRDRIEQTIAYMRPMLVKFGYCRSPR